MKKQSLTDDIAYRALLDKDPQFEGQFYAAVKTTGIFCRPTCRARKPKRENVEFFITAREAMAHGYRPCRICRPMERAGETPPEIRALLRSMEASPALKITDSVLAQNGLGPGRVRRWFLKNIGMSFQAYRRMLRINTALQNIRNGDAVIDAAFDSGYESLSGFQYSFKKATAKSPAQSRAAGYLVFERFTTPLGPMIAVANPEGVCLLEFTDRRMLEAELKRLRRHFRSEILPGASGHIERLRTQLSEYFEGARKEFDVPLVTPGSEFQKSVWRLLMEIPYGSAVSYRDQAVRLGKPRAVRAVARANGSNRISIIIPCHRVIGADGSLTGYGGGLWRKQWLLDHERAHAAASIHGDISPK